METEKLKDNLMSVASDKNQLEATVKKISRDDLVDLLHDMSAERLVTSNLTTLRENVVSLLRSKHVYEKILGRKNRK